MSSLFTRSDGLTPVPCTITATSPLTVTIGSTAGILGVPQKNVTYNTGPAVAYVRRVGRPFIYAIGS